MYCIVLYISFEKMNILLHVHSLGQLGCLRKSHSSWVESEICDSLSQGGVQKVHTSTQDILWTAPKLLDSLDSVKQMTNSSE